MDSLRRNRRLRTNEVIRNLVRETVVTPNDFIVPLFVIEGKGVKEEIPSMPNYFRFSLDLLEKEVKELWHLGLKSVLLFVKVPDNLKDNKGTEALNPNGLMQRAIHCVKEAVPQMLVMTDVALDPYSIFGHDGIIENGQIINDPTVEVLSQMALSHAQAGADFVAPSDMMDRRIFSIRNILDNNNLTNTGIIAYSAKYPDSLARTDQTDGDADARIAPDFVEHHGRTVLLRWAHARAACADMAVHAGKLGNRIDFHIGGHQFARKGFEKFQRGTQVVNMGDGFRGLSGHLDYLYRKRRHDARRSVGRRTSR